MSRAIQTIVSMLVLAFASTTGFAASTGVINVDLDYAASGATYTGLAAAPDPAGGSAVWNGVSIAGNQISTSPNEASGTSLKDSGGAITGATFDLKNYYSFAGPYTDVHQTIAVPLFDDFAYVYALGGYPTATYTISGLIPGAPYDLYLYAMTGFYAGDTSFTVSSITTDVSNDPTGFDGSHFVAVPTGTTGDGNYVLYSHVIATGGVISGTFTGGNSTRLNGLQLVVVPEPASLGLLLAGGVMLLRRRRADKTFVKKARLTPSNSGIIALAAVVSLLTAGLTQAASTVINVDFNLTAGTSGTYSGTGAAPDSGIIWNGFNVGHNFGPFTPTSGALVMSDGTLTSATVTLGDDATHNYNVIDISGSPVAPALFNDFIYSTGSSGFDTFTINNLVAGAPYDLYLYSMNGYPNSDDTFFTVNSITTHVTGYPTVDGTSGGSPQTAFNDVPGDNYNYVLYSHIFATGGTITGTFSGTNVRFDGFQLVEAPEPASLGLLLAGGVMLLRRRPASNKRTRGLTSAAGHNNETFIQKGRIMSRNTGMFALVAVVSLFMAGLANAASTAINVDFNTSGTNVHTPAGTYVGLGAAPDVVTNTFWNGVVIGATATGYSSFTSPGSLTESDGTLTTGITFTLGAFTAENFQGQYSNLPSGGGVAGYVNTFAPDLFGDGAYDSNGLTSPTSTYSIHGLDPAAPYDLYLYSMTGYPNSNSTSFTVDGIAGSTTITGLPSVYGSAFAAVTAGTTGGGNYVLYSHLIATSGIISGTFTGSNSRFSGFQIVEVPEPASLGLLLAGGVMLLRRRRRA